MLSVKRCSHSQDQELNLGPQQDQQMFSTTELIHRDFLSHVTLHFNHEIRLYALNPMKQVIVLHFHSWMLCWMLRNEVYLRKLSHHPFPAQS